MSKLNIDIYDSSETYLRIVSTILQYFQQTAGHIPKNVEDIETINNFYEENKDNVTFTFGDEGVITMITRDMFIQTVLDSLRCSKFLEVIQNSAYFFGESPEYRVSYNAFKQFLLSVMSHAVEEEYYIFSEDVKWALHDEHSLFVFHQN